MTPAEKSIVRSLSAVAWADGKVQEGELSVIEGLLCGFDASPEEEAELLAYAASPRSIDKDIPLEELAFSDRELLLENAALLVMTDGLLSQGERAVLKHLADVLGFDEQQLDLAIRHSVPGT